MDSINNVIMEYEPKIRLAGFLGIFTIMTIWELLAPYKKNTASKGFRWINNILLVVLNTVALRFVSPWSAVGLAALLKNNGWTGILGLIEIEWVEFILGWLLLDMLIYWQHLFFHIVPILWHLHKVHHVDMDLDITSGSRFHTIEIILSMGIKLIAIVILGTTPASVFVFELFLNLCAMFNHSNIHIPYSIDKYIRWLLVTPDMHRIHHSTEVPETNSNYGFNFTWWDKLFGTYIAIPKLGQYDVVIGVAEYRNEVTCHRLDKMLIMPFDGIETQNPQIGVDKSK